jgi:predicted HD phosphohydrolase
MKDGTQQDWEIIGAEFFEFRGEVCHRIKSHLMLLEGDCGGFAVDRLTHSLQTATLAHQDGKDEEYVGVRLAPRHWRYLGSGEPCRRGGGVA